MERLILICRVATMLFGFAAFVAGLTWGGYQADWDDWSEKTCVTWTTISETKDPTSCNIVVHLEEPHTETSAQWNSVICECDDQPCLQRHNNTGTMVPCFYETDPHPKVQMGSHPDIDPAPAKITCFVFTVFAIVFASFGLYIRWKQKQLEKQQEERSALLN